MRQNSLEFYENIYYKCSEGYIHTVLTTFFILFKFLLCSYLDTFLINTRLLLHLMKITQNVMQLKTFLHY